MPSELSQSERPGKTIIFMGGGSRKEVTQSDLAEERLLTYQAAKALRLLERKRKILKAAIQGGAEIEPGLYTAELVLRRRSPSKESEFLSLVVR